MKRIVLVFGLFSGLVVAIIMSISMMTMYKNPEFEGGTRAMIVGYLSMLIAFSLIYVGVKNYRDKKGNGFVSFGRAFSIGLLIALIGSTIYVIAWALLYNFYMPDFADRYGAQMMKQAAAAGNAVEMKQKAAEVEQFKQLYKSPLFFALMTYAEILPVGILVSLITALILKRKRQKLGVSMA